MRTLKYICIRAYEEGKNVYIYIRNKEKKERKKRKKEYYRPAGRRLMLCRRLRLVGTLCSQESRPRLYISTKDLLSMKRCVLPHVVSVSFSLSFSRTHVVSSLSHSFPFSRTPVLALTLSFTHRSFGPLPVDDCNDALARGSTSFALPPPPEQYSVNDQNVLLAYNNNI